MDRTLRVVLLRAVAERTRANEMSPSLGAGTRTSAEVYKVAVDVQPA